MFREDLKKLPEGERNTMLMLFLGELKVKNLLPELEIQLKQEEVEYSLKAAKLAAEGEG